MLWFSGDFVCFLCSLPFQHFTHKRCLQVVGLTMRGVMWNRFSIKNLLVDSNSSLMWRLVTWRFHVYVWNTKLLKDLWISLETKIILFFIKYHGWYLLTIAFVAKMKICYKLHIAFSFPWQTKSRVIVMKCPIIRMENDDDGGVECSKVSWSYTTAESSSSVLCKGNIAMSRAWWWINEILD